MCETKKHLLPSYYTRKPWAKFIPTVEWGEGESLHPILVFRLGEESRLGVWKYTFLLRRREGGEKRSLFCAKITGNFACGGKKGKGEENRGGGSQGGGAGSIFSFPHAPGLPDTGCVQNYKEKPFVPSSMPSSSNGLDGMERSGEKKLFFTSSPFRYGRKEPLLRCAKLLTPLLCSTFFCQTWGHGMEIIVLLHCRKFSFTSSMWVCSEHTAMWIDKILGFEDFKWNILFGKFLFSFPYFSDTFFPGKGEG